MKKLLLFSIFCSFFFNQLNAQFSCSTAVPITNGFTGSVTTPGAGANGWVTSATVCGGGSGTAPLAVPLQAAYFTTSGDDYVYSYTTGPVAGETAVFQINTKVLYTGLMAFTGCNGTALTGCIQGIASGTYGGSATTPYMLKVTASNLGANQTIYFVVGKNGSTGGALNFDVTNFTVTGGSLATNEVNIKNEKLDIYPNPVNDFLNFNNIENNSIVKIVDMSGKEVINTTLKKDEKLNVSSLEKGVYIVNVGVGENKKTYRIVKK